MDDRQFIRQIPALPRSNALNIGFLMGLTVWILAAIVLELVFLEGLALSVGTRNIAEFIHNVARPLVKFLFIGGTLLCLIGLLMSVYGIVRQQRLSAAGCALCLTLLFLLPMSFISLMLGEHPDSKGNIVSSLGEWESRYDPPRPVEK